MSSTIALQSKQSRRHWTLAIVLLVAAVVATIALTVAAFSGAGDTPANPVPAAHVSSAPDCVAGAGYKVC